MKIAVIGLGLIGGSIAGALSGDHEIIGLDSNKSSVSLAIKKGYIKRETDFAAIKKEKPEIVILALPVPLIRECAVKVYEALGDSAIITDVCSVKGILKGLKGRIVGGHPMAGTENSGFTFAYKELFNDKYYILVKYENTSEIDVETVKTALKPLNSKIKIMDADYHDRLVANVSHLPHAVAYSLASSLTTDDGNEVAGTGFLDTTRIASSSPDFWTSVFLFNKDNVINEINCFTESLNKLKTAIEKEDIGAVNNFLANGKKIRDELKKKEKKS